MKRNISVVPVLLKKDLGLASKVFTSFCKMGKINYLAGAITVTTT